TVQVVRVGPVFRSAYVYCQDDGARPVPLGFAQPTAAADRRNHSSLCDGHADGTEPALYDQECGSQPVRGGYFRPDVSGGAKLGTACGTCSAQSKDDALRAPSVATRPAPPLGGAVGCGRARRGRLP